jgi:4-amino-4-deoxy-L-arabinose transferase-like glycosyltransferase
MPNTDDNVRQTKSHLGPIIWSILILATLFICYLRNLGAIGLVGPDEPRYAWIARDMAESGDWITPRLYGQPWFEKPALYYWGAALSFKLFGVSEVTARLPSAISALLATLAMAWLAWRVYGAETARWVLLFLPTTVAMIGFSHAAAPDMPFTATLSLALVCIAEILGLLRSADSPILPRTPWLALILLGFFLGLAVLAKGPAAVILAGGAVLLWAAFTKRWRDALRCLHPVAIASFCLAALPWYILCARRNPDFFRVFIIEHNFKRYLTPEFQHIQPFWYYIPILLIAFLPWMFALLWSTFYGATRILPDRRPSQITTLLLSYALFGLVFFSISKSKLPGYILPAVPVIGLLLARSYTHLVPRAEKSFQWLQLLFSLAAALGGFLFLGFFGRSFGFYRAHATGAISVAWVLLLFALANLLLSFRRPVTARSIELNSLCVLPILILVFLFPRLSEGWFRYDPSGKTIARELVARNIPLDQIYIGKMNRGQEYSLDFYLHHEMRTWSKENPKDGYLLISSQDCWNFVKAPWDCSSAPVIFGSSGWFVYRVERANASE